MSKIKNAFWDEIDAADIPDFDTLAQNSAGYAEFQLREAIDFARRKMSRADIEEIYRKEMERA